MIKPYLIYVCQKNCKFGALPFSNLCTFIIETKNLDYSTKLARSLPKNRLWMEEWLQKPVHKVLVVQTREGIAERIENFKPTA